MIKTKILNFFNYGLDRETVKIADIALIHVTKKQRRRFLKKIRFSQKLNPNKLKVVLLQVSQKKKSLHFLDGFVRAGV